MMSRIKALAKIVLFVKNWPSVLWNVFVLRRGATARFNGGHTFAVSPSKWGDFMQEVDFFRYFPKGEINGTKATILYEGKELTLSFNNKDLKPINLGEVFGQKAYDPFCKDINFSGRTVVDVGASFGDTPVYFTLRGAKKVVAIEPLPSYVPLIRENMALNGFSPVCDVIHAGVGQKELPDIADDPMFKVVFGSYEALRSEFGSQNIPVITLETIVKKYSISDGVLKVDCEGWEYPIFGSVPRETLRRFEYILIEYHYGFEELEKMISGAGFTVAHTNFTAIHVPQRQGEYQNMRVGFLFAHRTGAK